MSIFAHFHMEAIQSAVRSNIIPAEQSMEVDK